MDAYRAGVGAFPLLLADEDKPLRIVALNGGRNMDRKLTDIGLAIGSMITIVSRHGQGRLVLARDEARIALGAGMAHRILVSPVEETE
jgi:ferrous iron transport protein A